MQQGAEIVSSNLRRSGTWPGACLVSHACRSATTVALLISVSSQPCVAATKSLCQPGKETVLFECSTGRKLISVCGSVDWSANTGSVQYRFGMPGRIELQVPDAALSPTSPKPTVKWGRIMLAGGGGATLRFSANGYEYTVYSAMTARLGDKAGVVVQARNRRLANIRCQSLDDATSLDIDLLQGSGLLEDEQQFVLP